MRKKRLPKNPFLAANLPGDWRPPKADDAVDPRSVGSPQLVADMLAVATYVGVRQGPRFAAFFGCMFYGLMRPAEVARLTKAGCYLPEKGCGVLTFGDSAPAPGREWTDSGDMHEERGLKGRSRKAVRRVPIPWRKVRSLSLTPDQLVTPLIERPCDLRHAGITWRLNSGVPAPDVAKWAGHSVEVLTRIYAGCVVGLDEVCGSPG